MAYRSIMRCYNMKLTRLFQVIGVICSVSILPSAAQNIIFNGCTGEADIVFLIDSSENTNSREFDISKSFVRKIVSELDIGADTTRIGVGSVADNGQVEFYMNYKYEKREIMDEINKIPFRRRGDMTSSAARSVNLVKERLFNFNGGMRLGIPHILLMVLSDRTSIGPDVAEAVQSLREDRDVEVMAAIYGEYRHKSDVIGDLSKIVNAPVEVNSIVVNPNDLLGDYASVLPPLCQMVPACAGQADITFILDRSGSVGLVNWEKMKNFTISIVNEMNIVDDGVRIAFIVFGLDAELVFNLNQYSTKAAIAKAITVIPFSESSYTFTNKALQLARLSVYGSQVGGNRINVRDIVILLSDGASYVQSLTQTEAQKLKDDGVRVFTIGVGREVQNEDPLRAEMEDIASEKKADHVFHLSNFAELVDIEKTLVRRTCKAAPPVCENKVDVVFILDSSGSVTRTNFKKILNFVYNTVQRLDTDSGKARVGLLTFNNTAYPRFMLNSYSKSSDIGNAIKNIEYGHGTTNAEAAFLYTEHHMFTATSGDRPDVPNVAILIHDGESQPKDTERAVDAARSLRDQSVTVLAVAIGYQWVNNKTLQAMASYPHTRNVMQTYSHDRLYEISDVLLSAMCNLENDCAYDPCLNGGTCIDDINFYHCKCVPGKTGRKCDKTCPNVVDLVIALDASGSIEQRNFVIMQDFVRDVVYGLNIDAGSRLAIVTFANHATVQFKLNDYSTTQEVLNAVSFRFTGGTTNTADALVKIRKEVFTPSGGDREDIINVAIIITDGKSNNRDQTLTEAVELKKLGVHIISIGVGQSVGVTELNGMVSDPYSINMKRVEDFDALTGILDFILEGTCNIQDECLSNPCRNGGICVDWSFKYTCKCRDGYTGINCERGCTEPYDLAFLVDTSGSVERENLPKVMDFLNDLVKQLDIGDDKINVALAYFNDVPHIQLPFRPKTSIVDVQFSIHEMGTKNAIGGKTNQAKAFNMMRSQVFNNKANGRNGVRNYMVVITDGVSNQDKAQAVPEAINSQIEGIHVILVLVGAGLTQGTRSFFELKGLASEPYPENIFSVNSYNELYTLVPGVTQAMCEDFDECLSNPCQNGGTCQNDIKQYRCDCLDIYTGVNCERECYTMNDIVLLVDVSGSLEGDLDLVVTFMKKLVNGLNFRLQRTRAAYIAFANKPQVKFKLDAMSGLREVINALRISELGYFTNIAAALRIVDNEIFKSENGDRTGVKNSLLLFSDGKATEEREMIKGVADAMKAKNIDMYAIGIGAVIDPITLMWIATASSGNDYYHQVTTRDEAEDNANKVLDVLCR